MVMAVGSVETNKRPHLKPILVVRTWMVRYGKVRRKRTGKGGSSAVSCSAGLTVGGFQGWVLIDEVAEEPTNRPIRPARSL